MIAIEGQIPVEVTLDPGLAFVAMKVFDVTLGYPGSQVGSAIPMVETDIGNYGASFSGTKDKSYFVSKAVYTDGTYVTRDTNYSSGSDAYQVIAPIQIQIPLPPTITAQVDQVSGVTAQMEIDFNIDVVVTSVVDLKPC